MFNKVIRETSMCGDIANAAFSNVRASALFGDVSLVSTMRALLASRLNGAAANAYVQNVGMRGTSVDDIESSTLWELCLQNFEFTENSICISPISCDPGTGDAFMEKLLGEEGIAYKPDWLREMPDLAQFVQKRMNARFFISEERKVTFILLTDLNVRKLHYLQAFIPRYMPWLFRDAPLQEDEIELLRSLMSRMSEEYEAAIGKFAEKFDLRGLMIDRMLGRFQKNAREAQIKCERDRLSTIMDRIRDIQNQYEEALQTCDSINIRLLGLTCAEGDLDDGDELVAYVRANKNIYPINAEGSSLSIVVKTYLDAFDPEVFSTMSRRSGSHLFTGYRIGNPAFESMESRLKFMRATFGDEPVLRIKTCANYALTVGGGVSTSRMFTYPADCNDCIPNPHIYFHACLGNHVRYINDRLHQGDFVGAIEQCVSSAKSINLAEGITVQRFFEKLFSRDIGKCIELPDKTVVTPESALEWLVNQEAKEQEEKEG